jgi:hypothetical protein
MMLLSIKRTVALISWNEDQGKFRYVLYMFDGNMMRLLRTEIVGKPAASCGQLNQRMVPMLYQHE